MPVRPQAISYTKIGQHRGRRRIWLEGRKLERAGILPGRRFSVTWDPESLQVVLDFSDSDRADRTVSRRSRNGRELPVIDIGNDLVEDALGAGIERAKVTIDIGRITVEVHPDDVAAQERLTRLVDKVSKGEPIATGSLAHGGGVLDHALHTGLVDNGVRARLAFAVEIDTDVLDAAARNNPIWDDQTLMIEGGMEEAEATHLPQVDVLVAGLPCTGASKAGKAKNHNAHTEDHPRAGALFVAFLRVVKETNPALIVLENVTDYAHSASASVIRATLSTWGYTVHETVVSGNEMGALEDRRRWCMVAASPELDIALDRLLPTRDKETCLGEILEDIDPQSDLWRDYAYLAEKALRDAAKGSNFKPNVVGPEAEKVGAIGAGYSKVRQTEAKVRHPEDANLKRLLTPAEHAAVKTIPPELVSGLSNTLAHQILGNSVIWAAWRAVGRRISEAVNDVTSPEIESPIIVLGRDLPEKVEEIVHGWDENEPNQMTIGF